MPKEISKINIGISQKINLGGYETRDYSLSLQIEGFDSSSLEEVRDAISFGRELCLEEVGDYYRKIKKSLLKVVETEDFDDTQLSSLDKRIREAADEKTVRGLESEIDAVKDSDSKKKLSRTFNLKLIELKETW